MCCEKLANPVSELVNFSQLTYLLPKFKNRILNFAKYIYSFATKFQNSKFNRNSGRILNFAKYQYFFTTKIQNSKIEIRAQQRPDCVFFIIASYHYLFTTNIQNSKFGRGSGRILNFASYQYLFTTQVQNSKVGRGSGRNLIFESC